MGAYRLHNRISLLADHYAKNSSSDPFKYTFEVIKLKGIPNAPPLMETILKKLAIMVDFPTN